MSRSGNIQRLLLVTCVILCVFVSAVTAGESQDFADNTTQVPVVQEHVATTITPIVQDLPVIARPSNMAPVNPAYLRYLQEQQQQQASGEQDSFNSLMSTSGTPVSSHPTGLIPTYEDLSHLKGTYVVDDDGISSPEKTILKEALPAKYDLRELGRVPPVKDQGNHGACWAFATLASLESTLLPNESWDFSENHMKNLLSDQYPDGFDRNYSKGGTHKMSTAYLVRWSGPVNQSDDPYNITSAYSPANLTVQKHVQRVDFIPDRKSSTDNTNIKTAVKAYGAVFTSYNVSDEIPAYWNESTYSYYYFGPDSANHAVAIVGWDDTWSRYNFSTVPPGDGAFIIKNSWGATWGDSGFFYCSYYDRLIGNESALFLSSPPKNYDHISQYDPLGWVSSIYTAGEKAGFAANVFNSTRKQNLSAVSFYTTDTNANYQVWVYVNPDNGPVLNSSGAAFTQSGTFANAGYHTIEIPNEIPLDANDRFAVAVNLTNPTYNWSIAIQDTSVETSKARAFPGRGYTSEDGSTWTDVTIPADQKNATLCIKAFTKDVQEPDLVGEIEADRAPMKFQNGTVFLNATLRIENEGTGDVNQPFTIKSNLLGKISDKRISDPIPVGRSKIICVNLWVIPGYGETQVSVSRVGDIEYNTIITDGSIPVGQNFIGEDIDIDNEIDEADEGNNNVSRMVFVTDASIMSANFTSNVTSGAAPLSVEFTDTSTGEPDGWAWFFGDEKYTQPWTLMNASAGWLVRFDHSSVTLPDGSIVLSGGNSSPTGLMNDVWRSTDNGVTWTRMTSHAEWTPRFEHSTVAMPDGSIVLSGGSATDGIKQDVWRSTNKGASWTQMTTSAEWGRRTDHSSVAMPDGSIILTGGYISSGYYKNDTWRSVNNGSSWTSVNASSGWTKRYHHTSVVLPDESIVLMGGFDSIIGRRNDTWRSVNGGATWTLMNASSGWTARYEHTSIAMPDGSILLMGGSATDGLKNDMWRSKDCGRTWSRVDESAAWNARGWQTTVVLPDGSIVLMGGGYEGVNYNNDVWRLVPTGSSEQNPSHTYTAPGIYPVALQAYNTGGLNSTQKKGFINVTELSAPVANFTANVTSGITPLPIRFTDTSTNTPSGWAWFFGDETYTQPWTRVNASAGWSARRHAGTVVVPDGSIILTGGFDYSGGDTWLNDTWRSTDRGVTWTLLSTSSGWSKRAVHSSVVLQDGSIVLMGGERNYVSLNDTWRSTDGGVTWTRVNASSGWMARYYHSSVVTPDGSIVLTGGVMDGSSSSWKNDTWRSTDKGETWILMN
ncbi:MAG: lectin like domain-containing protein, partial [Methanoregula sp.]